ncbi:MULTISPECIES: hypothetical protein [unclassified Maridesulfovibrio]|uniref:hypothetical protein n=1 Tax=unclassified Maridesulfovibrio TaxID=2794999 RepID=UPI003B432E3C
MADKIPDKFMSVSKKVLEEDPDLKRKLEKVMGRVADTIVKAKYVQDDSPTSPESKESKD